MVQPPILPGDESIGSLAADVIDSLQLTASLYLKEVRQELDLNTAIETHVETGFAADTLLRIARDQEVGLVIMSTHGRGGVLRWTLGSVADGLLRGATPVLLVRPAKEESAEP